MPVEKKEDATMNCGFCDRDLVCVKFTFENQDKLSWCDKDTKNKHFRFDENENKSHCKFEGLIDISKIDDQIDIIDHIERRVKERLETDNDYKIGMYTKVIYLNLSKAN